MVPRGDGTPEDDFPTRIQAAVFGYVRGQLLFSLIMGTSAGVLLWVLGSLGIFPEGKTYAVAFGAWYGFAELIPYVGPAIGAFPPVLIALFSGEPLDAVWLVIAFTALQQIEGHIVAPTVFSQALRINPLLVIFALLLGGQLYGFLGRVHRAADRGDPARDGRLHAPPRAPGAVGPARRGARHGRRSPRTTPEPPPAPADEPRPRSRGALPRVRRPAPAGRRRLPGVRDRARRRRRGGLRGGVRAAVASGR